MKACFLICALLTSFVLLSCEDEHLPLDVNKHQQFEGSFSVKTDTKAYNQSGTSTLEISNGSYKAYTNGILSAGLVKTSSNKIIFTDTVFKIYNANIIPPTSLNGTYDYAFDGDRLEIGNRHQSSWIEKHTLRLKD